MRENNVIVEKAEVFAVRIVKLCRYLKKSGCEFELISQIMRSGTSIGANVHEAVFAQSHKDFVSKMNIALKEANETVYWIRLLNRTENLTLQQFESINADCVEILKILTAIVKSSKEV